MKSINYISYYAEQDNPEKRVIALSAVNKINYICDVLIRLGYEVKIVSPSTTNDSEKGYKGKTIYIKEGLSLRSFSTLPWNRMWQKMISIIISKIGVIVTLLRLKRGEKVVVYHSLGYMNLINALHRIKRFHLILEVEEIYADVIGDDVLKTREIRFLKSAENYIFPAKMLGDLINTDNKPSVYIHGTYQVENEIISHNSFDSTCVTDKPIIHCVYAGTLDPRKGGAIAAANVAFYLPENYHIHIIGFGSEEDIERIEDIVTKVRRMKCAKLSYDGLLSGNDYIAFLQGCDVGLSTQDPTASFNDTSFPSKILSYMANGLRVVCVKIPVVEQSAISQELYYYEEQQPQQIADAIMGIDFSTEYDSRALIARLDKEFEENLSQLLIR